MRVLGVRHPGGGTCGLLAERCEAGGHELTEWIPGAGEPVGSLVTSSCPSQTFPTAGRPAASGALNQDGSSVNQDGSSVNETMLRWCRETGLGSCDAWAMR